MYGLCVCFETHIPISQVPIIMCIMRDHVFTKCMNALQQVQNILFYLIIYIYHHYKGHCSWGKANLNCGRRRHRDLQMGWAQSGGDALTLSPCSPTQIPYIWLRHLLLREPNSVTQVPRAVDALQGVLTVIPLQLLSYHLAVLRFENFLLLPLFKSNFQGLQCGLPEKFGQICHCWVNRMQMKMLLFYR